jgi:hypothetical protein
MSENTAPLPEPTPPNPDEEMTAALFLSALQGSTQRQLDMLRIITNPANNSGNIDGETPDEIAASYEENFEGYMGDHEHEVDIVSDFLYSHYSALSDMPDFLFGFDAGTDGIIGGFRVMVDLEQPGGWQDRLTLTSWGDIKNSTYDRDASGLAAALAIAEVLDDHYQALIAKARRRGLIPVNPDVVRDAQTALDAYNVSGATELDASDPATVRAMRDALSALISAQCLPADPARSGSGA